MTMSLPSRQEYIRTMKQRYWQCTSSSEKTLIINEAVTMTGYHRKYLIGLLNDHHLYPAHKRSVQRKRPLRYQDSLPAIKRVWQALDYPCAERLQPVLLATALHLAGFGEILLTPQIRHELATISRSTLARRMSSWERTEPVCLPFSAALHQVPRRQILIDIPIDRYPWDEERLGALEGDLVEHNGGSSTGHYAYTLSLVDVVPGWSRRRAFLGRGGTVVEGSLEQLLGQWPYPAWGLHTDSGSEFLNHHLQRFCARWNLIQTRSRPYRKNDNAHVEQKNGHSMRRVVGYDRYDTSQAVDWLNHLYARLDLYVNLFLPLRKVVKKTRMGSRVRKSFDQARTPLDRVLETGLMAETTDKRLRDLRDSLNPLSLQREIFHLLSVGPDAWSEQEVLSEIVEQDPVLVGSGF